MKLKSIMYALGYGKPRKTLVRSEGARRVKQAETQMKLRQIQKNLTYLYRDGNGGDLKPVGIKERSVSAPKTFGVPYGQVDTIVCGGVLDKLKIEEFLDSSGVDCNVHTIG